MTLMVAMLLQDALFENMKKAIETKEEALFKAQWHADGFEKNLVGGSGLAGKEVFGQGSRKKWYLKPDLAKAVAVAETASIVPCDVWAWEKAKAVDQVHILAVKDKDAWIVLGGGEKIEQVRALADRWLKKEPLPPPAEK
ncbi:MAG TPA: hypothetical protein VF950_13335 [Planctomycetota bacterium]